MLTVNIGKTSQGASNSAGAKKTGDVLLAAWEFSHGAIGFCIGLMLTVNTTLKGTDMSMTRMHQQVLMTHMGIKEITEKAVNTALDFKRMCPETFTGNLEDTALCCQVLIECEDLGMVTDYVSSHRCPSGIRAEIHNMGAAPRIVVYIDE